MLLNELIIKYGSEVDNSINQLSGLITQQKILKNTDYALQTQISEQTDSIFSSLDDVSSFDKLDFNFSKSLEVSVLDSGSTELEKYSLYTIDDLKDIYNQYITKLPKPESDSEEVSQRGTVVSQWGRGMR